MLNLPASSNSSSCFHRPARCALRSLRSLVCLCAGLVTLLAPATAQGEPVTLTGKAILEHPAGKAMIAAGRLLKAGRAAESRKVAAKEIREEWAAMSAAEQKEEAARLQERAPDPAGFEADIARVGEMVVDGDHARIMIQTASGDPSAMAFAALEGGKWRADRGPMTLQVPEPETAPAIRGAAILDHELGKLAIDYAGKLAAGKFEAALDLVAVVARARLAALPPDERKQSDDFRRKQLPKPDVLASHIRSGGELTFTDKKAVLNVVTTSTKKNADGGVTSTSETIILAFRNDFNRWTIAD